MVRWGSLIGKKRKFVESPVLDSRTGSLEEVAQGSRAPSRRRIDRPLGSDGSVRRDEDRSRQVDHRGGSYSQGVVSFAIRKPPFS